MNTEFKFKVGDRIHFSHMYNNYDSLEVISIIEGSYLNEYVVSDKDSNRNVYDRSYIDPCYEIDKIYQRNVKLEKLLS
jgi:hypothetical protein